jgi:hypothetical protein
VGEKVREVGVGDDADQVPDVVDDGQAFDVVRAERRRGGFDRGVDRRRHERAGHYLGDRRGLGITAGRDQSRDVDVGQDPDGIVALADDQRADSPVGQPARGGAHRLVGLDRLDGRPHHFADLDRHEH